MKTKYYEEATKDLKAAIKLDPQNKNIRNQFEALKTLKEKAKEKSKNVYGAMFSESVYDEKRGKDVKEDFKKLPDFNQ